MSARQPNGWYRVDGIAFLSAELVWTRAHMYGAARLGRQFLATFNQMLVFLSNVDVFQDFNDFWQTTQIKKAKEHQHSHTNSRKLSSLWNRNYEQSREHLFLLLIHFSFFGASPYLLVPVFAKKTSPPEIRRQGVF